MTQKDLEKLQKMASLKNDGQLILLNEIEDSKVELIDKLDKGADFLVSTSNEIIAKIDAIEIPTPKDYTSDMKELRDLIEEPTEVEVSLNIT